MPELPEVETVRLQLERKVAGKTIESVTVLNRKTVANDTKINKKLANLKVESISRVGKLMIFNFAGDNDIHLLAHLKMTGQFFFADKKGNVVGGGHSFTESDTKLPNKHTRSIFHFTDGTSLYFNDMRMFGYTKVASKKETAKAKSNYGPEPINPDFDVEWFTNALHKRKTAVKAALLNQSFIAGLGNIYVDEALWRAKVKPTRKANLVTKLKAAAIAAASGDVMNESIAMGGTTFQHFADTDGNKGNFSTKLKVFGKQNTPCERCGGIVKKIRVAGRGTHFCPKCQK